MNFATFSDAHRHGRGTRNCKIGSCAPRGVTRPCTRSSARAGDGGALLPSIGPGTARTPPTRPKAARSARAFRFGPWQRRRTIAERRRMTLALLLSLLLHTLLLGLIFGDGTGLPGFGFPWRERRIEAPDLRAVLVPAEVAVAESAGAAATRAAAAGTEQAVCCRCARPRRSRITVAAPGPVARTRCAQGKAGGADQADGSGQTRRHDPSGSCDGCSAQCQASACDCASAHRRLR